MKKFLLIIIVTFFAVTLFAKDKESDKNNKGGLKSAGLISSAPGISTGPTTSNFYFSNNISYTWTDISGTGTELVPGIDDDDASYGPFEIGFSFPFYENSHTQFYFGTNGTIYFEDNYLGYGYVNIPGDPDYGVLEFIAWHWTDLGMYSSSSAAVYSQQFADYTIIQFDNYSDYSYDENIANAQVVLYKNGNVEIRYKSAMPSDYTEYFAIGIQKDETEGLEIDYVEEPEDNQNAVVQEAVGLKSVSAESGFFDNLPKSILIVNKANAEPVPFSIYSFLALFALIGGATVFKLRKKIFNMA